MSMKVRYQVGGAAQVEEVEGVLRVVMGAVNEMGNVSVQRRELVLESPGKDPVRVRVASLNYLEIVE